MKRALSWLPLFVLATLPAASQEAALDRAEQALSWTTPDGVVRARLAGLLDLEGFVVPHPAPALIDTEGHALFSPRLSLFLDAQAGEHLYGFLQARGDRGFDPSDGPVTARLDEYALRYRWGGETRAAVQVGKFATVVGNWTNRHDSWQNPFVTAPLVYESLTGIWDTEQPRSVGQLLSWSHLRTPSNPAMLEHDKYVRVPVIWGPSYATGVSVAVVSGKLGGTVEVKNASLSSRPETWRSSGRSWNHPTLSGRFRIRPSEAWEVGWSASSGSYLRPNAIALNPGRTRGAYRQTVVAQDVSYSRRHLQLWAEVFAARYRIPEIGNADLIGFYLESKYRFTPRFSGAVRWNQQLFGTLNENGRDMRWGRDTWRIDAAPEFRIDPHTQLKLQYSVQRGADDRKGLAHTLALQATLKL